MTLAAIEFRHLRYFVAVVEQRSFRAAALALHVSQPPLTRQVQQLEEALGVALLQRKPRGVETTDAGAIFYEEARNLLGLLDQGAKRTQLAAQGQIGRLDIGIFGSAVLDTIPRIIQAFRTRHPRVEIVLHNLDRYGQVRALRERRIHVGFNRFFEKEPDLTWEVVQTEHMNVALQAAHALADRSDLTLDDIGGEPLILYPRTPRPSFIDHILRQFHSKGITPRVMYEVDDLITAVALVSSGFGISVVTDSAVNLQLPNLAYVPLRQDREGSFELCMIRRKDDDSPLLEAFFATARSMRPQLGQRGPTQTEGATPPGGR